MDPHVQSTLLLEGQGKSDTASLDAKSDSDVSSSSDKATPGCSRFTLPGSDSTPRSSTNSGDFSGKSDTASSDAKSDSDVSSSSDKAPPGGSRFTLPGSGSTTPSSTNSAADTSKSTQHLQPVATSENDQVHHPTTGFQPSSTSWRLRPKNQLHENFTDISHLGTGACSTGVFKGTHKHDGREYALKIVELEQDAERTLREVKILAQLSHPNVVRYHTCWMDPADFTDWIYDDSSSSVTDSGDTSSSKPDSSFQKLSSDDVIFDQNAQSGSKGEESQEFHPEVPPNSAEQSTADQYLHIKMELCHSTLKEWLLKRNLELGESRGNVPVEDCDNILEQILKGLAYIHSKDVIHRDLKPANIFLVNSASSPGPIVKIGDFGLARELLSTSCGSPTGPHQGSGDHNQVQLSIVEGTRPYTSPEQLAGPDYTNKTDMFSLGMIMFELYYPLGETEMEKRDCFSKIKKRDCDDLLSCLPPKQRDYVRKLTSEDPESRPTAKEMLEDLFPDKDQQILKLKQRCQELENTLPGVLMATSSVSQNDSCDEEPAQSDAADKDDTIATLRERIRTLELNQKESTETKRSVSDRRISKSV